MGDDVQANAQLHLLGQRPARNTAGERRGRERNSLSRNYFEHRKLQSSVERGRRNSGERERESEVAVLGGHERTEERGSSEDSSGGDGGGRLLGGLCVHGGIPPKGSCSLPRDSLCPPHIPQNRRKTAAPSPSAPLQGWGIPPSAMGRAEHSHKTTQPLARGIQRGLCLSAGFGLYQQGTEEGIQRFSSS